MKLHNHIAFKMGAHEAEIAPHISEGGNWQDIPLSIEDARLRNIRSTGGRTTYYGRMHRDKPSYTIATYFNRVGNGCNLHPTQNRVISNREAARLQSFPDDFIFQGSRASQYKQIGNAVPPLLARYVSSLIKPHLTSYNMVDLFAGCGGMSEGFIMNGFNLIAANEIDKNIMSTNRFNHSRSNESADFVIGDITLQETKQKLIDLCSEKKIDVIIGGPPCQGFSYAGWRDPNDTRNQLFKEFVCMVNVLRPDFFVMENVLGILSMRKGEAIKEIISAFTEIGYTVNAPLKLNAADYGVPQRRKRVFIIGSLNHDVKLSEPTPLFSDDGLTLPKYISVEDAIFSFPAITDGGGDVVMDYIPQASSNYDRLMRHEIDFDEFYRLCTEV
ncbi:MAG: DNA (cytosine-5-)-methyltransferase [Muribaculaceae bacterium]|nr:DNA (cytosine-5-)-methyltransferase [Muribaculaceae bacterium]